MLNQTKKIQKRSSQQRLHTTQLCNVGRFMGDMQTANAVRFAYPHDEFKNGALLSSHLTEQIFLKNKNNFKSKRKNVNKNIRLTADNAAILTPESGEQLPKPITEQITAKKRHRTPRNTENSNVLDLDHYRTEPKNSYEYVLEHFRGDPQDPKAEYEIERLHKEFRILREVIVQSD